ncbi:MAG: hypothetical protein VX438_16535 [Planctomycetota bacterium]|nr:hypothetical protein [Planctomycetota bacterium]
MLFIPLSMIYRITSLIAVAWFFHSFLALALMGQEKLKPGRLPSEVRKSLVAGLLVEYFSESEDLLDSDIQRFPAVWIGPDEPVTPFVQTRKTRIRYAGYLKLKLKGTYRFSLVGNGDIRLLINDIDLTKGQGNLSTMTQATANLVKGYNKFELTYRPPEKGAAKFRVYWENEDFVKEPVPSSAFWTSVAENASSGAKSIQSISDHGLLHRGRDLFITHNCGNCHGTGEQTHELFQERDTPDLAIASSRINGDWLEEWIESPAKMRNSITMPHLFDESARSKSEIVDLAAYIGALRPGGDAPTREGNAESGGNTFENLGCIGCHHFSEPGLEDEYERVSLYYTAAKFRPGKLAEFLDDSRVHYKWSRMPKFRLTQKEGNDLEAFIREESQGKVKGVESGTKPDPVSGKKIFQLKGCSSCHSVPDNAAMNGEIQLLQSVDLVTANPAMGCLIPPAKRNLKSRSPDYRFKESERKALQLLVRARASHSFSKVNSGYFASRSVKEMRCTTCHDLDEVQATLPYIIEEEGVVGLPPNRVPMLTYAGEKLLPTWSEKLIQGKLSYRVREHFRVQMPGFPARGSLVAHGFSQIHGFGPNENVVFRPDTEKMKHGASVAAMETGLSCNRCHAIADKKPNAAFDAQSTNLIYAAQRLRKEYYLRWMFDPLRIDKQTKMPKFSEDGQSTSLRSIYEGDALKQFESLWQYLNSIKANP